MDGRLDWRRRSERAGRVAVPVACYKVDSFFVASRLLAAADTKNRQLFRKENSLQEDLFTVFFIIKDFVCFYNEWIPEGKWRGDDCMDD